jgi:hypothetical protein
MDRGRMWERRGGYERVEVRRGEVRKRTDVPLHKRVHCLPTHTTISAEGAAILYYREVWKHHGLPRQVLSD